VAITERVELLDYAMATDIFRFDLRAMTAAIDGYSAVPEARSPDRRKHDGTGESIRARKVVRVQTRCYRDIDRVRSASAPWFR
jgi:hypothetical protein